MKIISGGQTGSDYGALLAAHDLNITTGGFCPKGFKTELGRNDKLIEFGLRETLSDGYWERTFKNVKSSDATLIIAHDWKSTGTVLTKNMCVKLDKPHIKFNFPYYDNTVSYEEYVTLIALGLLDIKPYNELILNVAGNRESVIGGIEIYSYDVVYTLIKKLQEISNSTI